MCRLGKWSNLSASEPVMNFDLGFVPTDVSVGLDRQLSIF